MANIYGEQGVSYNPEAPIQPRGSAAARASSVKRKSNQLSVSQGARATLTVGDAERGGRSSCSYSPGPIYTLSRDSREHNSVTASSLLESRRRPSHIIRSSESLGAKSSELYRNQIAEAYRQEEFEGKSHSEHDHQRDKTTSERYIKRCAVYTQLLNWSVIFNILTIFFLVLEWFQYIIPNKTFYILTAFFNSSSSVKILFGMQTVCMFTSLCNYVYNMLHRVDTYCNKHLALMLTSLCVYIVKIIWDVIIHDYRNLIVMNNSIVEQASASQNYGQAEDLGG